MKKYLLLLCLIAGFSAHGQTDTAQQTKKSPVYHMVEQMPEPLVDVGTYLSQNIVYPARAKAMGIQGRVAVKFLINEDGSISDVEVVRGIGGGCDDEAVRVVKSMPKWIPGRQNGKNAKVYYTLPIDFKLTDTVPANSK